MPLSPALTGTVGTLPLPNTAPTPKNGELVRAEDVQAAVQALLDQDVTLERTALVHGRTFVAYNNNGALVYSGAGFTVAHSFTFSALVPTGGTGVTTSALWTTPAVADAPGYCIDSIVLQIEASASASSNPANVQFEVFVGTVSAILGLTSSWGGTTYTLNGGSSRKTIFGLATSEKQTLFTPPAGDGTDDLGYSVDQITGAVYVLADGGVNGLSGKDITIQITHGSISGVTLTIPLKLIVRGHFI